GAIIQDGPSSLVVGRYLNEGFGGSAVREWPDPAQAPGKEAARLCAVRGRLKNGEIGNSVDVREPISFEREYDVLKPDSMIFPHYGFRNEHGVYAFPACDTDPEWRGKTRPRGHYISRVSIPGNFLAPGILFVSPAIITLNPFVIQFAETDAV